jgi:hypothetical protein
MSAPSHDDLILWLACKQAKALLEVPATADKP